MADRKDGGPAFPVPADEYAAVYGGMTLRDWFAGQALAGLYASLGGKEDEPQLSDMAGDCYRIADAMIAERDKE